jgi:RNase H-like domain found in reverse transcriptase
VRVATVTTDASGFAIGAVLEQDEDGFRRPVAYFSRTMNPHENNYHAQEQEILAIVEALRRWRSYLHGRTFLAQTDHASLQYITTKDHLIPRQVRWLERLIYFDFKIVHISGKANIVADASTALQKTYLLVITQIKPFYWMLYDEPHHTKVLT